MNWRTETEPCPIPVTSRAALEGLLQDISETAAELQDRIADLEDQNVCEEARGKLAFLINRLGADHTHLADALRLVRGNLADPGRRQLQALRIEMLERDIAAHEGGPFSRREF